MNTAKTIEWPELTGHGRDMIKILAEREYNEIASEYGGTLIPQARKPMQQEERYKLLAANDVAMSEPVQWRVKKVLPDKGIGAIYGPSSSGKSFLVLDLLMSISKGEQWFNKKTKKCPVVYLCLEGEGGLSNRVAAYLKNKPIGDNVSFVKQPCNLFNVKDVRDLVKAIKSEGATQGVLVIDTLNSSVPGMDENGSADMSKAIDILKQVQREIGGFIIMIHHSGKDVTKGMRGHSSLFAALDMAIEVKRSGDVREWKQAKAKDGEDGFIHSFRLEQVCLGMDEDGEPITSCVIRPATNSEARISKPLTPNQQLGMDAFNAAAASNIGSNDMRVHAHLEQWRTEFYRSSTADKQETKQKAFNRARRDLVDLEKLVVQDDVYTLPNGFSAIAGHGTEAGH